MANRYPVGSMHWAAEVARTWHAAQAAKRSQEADRARREREALSLGKVGYLTWSPFGDAGWFVVCCVCAYSGRCSVAASIYGVNIYPYRQSCCACGRVLVEGQSPAWCELYAGKVAS